jgi:hypothetical protein
MLKQNGFVNDVGCRDTNRFAKPETHKLTDTCHLSLGVGFVGDEDYVEVGFAKFAGHLDIEGHYTFTNINDEQNDVCSCDSLVDLVVNVLGKIFDIDDAVAAGVDEFKEPLAALNDSRNPVARNAGCLFDDAYHLAAYAIKQAAFADIWTANDCNYW